MKKRYIAAICIVLLAILIFPHWIDRLDPITNLINVFMLATDILRIPMHLVPETDLDAHFNDWIIIN